MALAQQSQQLIFQQQTKFQNVQVRGKQPLKILPLPSAPSSGTYQGIQPTQMPLMSKPMPMFAPMIQAHPPPMSYIPLPTIVPAYPHPTSKNQESFPPSSDFCHNLSQPIQPSTTVLSTDCPENRMHEEMISFDSPTLAGDKLLDMDTDPTLLFESLDDGMDVIEDPDDLFGSYLGQLS